MSTNSSSLTRRGLQVIAAVVLAAAALAASPAEAASCTDEIARFEQAIRQSAATPDAGPTAPQSRAAQLHRQPTLRSIAEAGGRARAAFEGSLADAKWFDAQGNADACNYALERARGMYLLSQ